MNFGKVRGKESPEGPVPEKKRHLRLAIAKFDRFGGFLRHKNFSARGRGLQPIPLAILRVLHIGLGG